MTVSLTGKALNKRKRFPLAIKYISTSWNEGFHVKNTFPLKKTEKKLSLLSVSEKWRNEWLRLARKSVSPTRNKLYLDGIVFIKLDFV